jgi:E2/UBC family protein E
MAEISQTDLLPENANLLPEIDREFLAEKNFEYAVEQEAGGLLLTFHNFELGSVYQPAQATLMIILPAGYPNAGPDMFWTHPTVVLRSGGPPQQCQHHENHGGRNWQRWSRHFHGWRVGIDSMRTYVAAIRRELSKGI